MKKNALILLLALTNMLVAFGQSNDYAALNLFGKVKSMSEKTFRPDESGFGFNKSEPVKWFLNSFSEKGNKILDVSLKPDSSVNKKYTYTYNEQGIRVGMTVYSAGDLLMFRIAYFYNDNGTLREDISYNEQNKPGERKEYLYGSNRLLMEENTINAENKLTQKTTYTYNSLNQVTETSDYDGSGQLRERTTFAYDPKGNVARETSFDSSGTLLSTTTNLYVMDERGNWVKKSSFVNNKPVQLTERKFLYY